MLLDMMLLNSFRTLLTVNTFMSGVVLLSMMYVHILSFIVNG